MKKTVFFVLISLMVFSFCSKKAEDQPAAQKNDQEGGLLSLMPGDNELQGWNKSSEVRTFNEGNLWEYIDGAADGYLMYAFQQVVTCEFKNEASGTEMVVDIYYHLDPVNTFGIYASERSTDYTFIKLGSEGYKGSSNVNFWKGTYYVKIVGFDDKEETVNNLLAMAKIIDGKIKDKPGQPAFLQKFPKENMIEHTQKYISKDFLGQSYMRNCFSAEYNIDGKTVKMFALDGKDAAEAESMYNKYIEFLNDSGKKINIVSGLGDAGLSTEDSFYGNIVVFRKGNIMGGILSPKSVAAGKEQLEGLIKNLH